jgi:hypothetical protein
MSEDFGPSQKRESVRMGVSGHSRELSMVEIAKFNKGMNEFFKRRGMHYGDGFRGIIGNEVKHARKRRQAAEEKAGQIKNPSPTSKNKKKERKKWRN